MLEWDDGVTTLSGQHVLPLEDETDLDDLFEQALDAEASGDLITAARFFETCAKADSKDALALFNLGNVRWAMDDLKGATLAFQQAIARDQRLTEAHFNLAGVREQAEDAAAARDHLKTALVLDPRYPDALFNLAQLELADENLLEAKGLFERCIVAVSEGPLKDNAQRALRLIAQKRATIR
jgi:tetratricopeptide (TPR) repeat protein